VREGEKRVVAAIQNSGYQIPPRRITINLAPASETKAEILEHAEAVSSNSWSGSDPHVTRTIARRLGRGYFVCTTSLGAIQ
jgi:hypothetical protein